MNQVTLIQATATLRSQALDRARSAATENGGPLRAPHHSISHTGIVEELALAACGSLVLEDVQHFSVGTLQTLFRLWRYMNEKARPNLILIWSEIMSSDVAPFEQIVRAFPPIDHHEIIEDRRSA